MAKDYFAKKYEIDAYPTPMQNVKEIIEYVQDTPNVLGVVPVENSIVGTVRETLDNLMVSNNEKLQILSEVTLPVNHCLLSKNTELYSIAGIIANTQALIQCREFIKNEMPRNLNIIEVTNSAEAARSLADYNLTYASIGTEKTAEIYNLNILKKPINDDQSNRTTFVLIGAFDTEETGHDRTTLMFTTDDRPGALLEILNIFYKNNVNLSYISSRPSKEDKDNYIFVVSLDGHIKQPEISDTINQVHEKTTSMRVMGSYEK
jgi:prephenate dehydratase